MKDRELFKACISQCMWCAEQWPLVMHRGDYTHAGPFTKDPQLFSWPCAAMSIRTAFGYMDFKGSKQIKFKPRPAEELVAIMTGYYEGNRKRNGLGKTITSPSNRSFWRGGSRACIEVASWPEWMRSTHVSGKAQKIETPEESAASLKHTRGELKFYDECDYWVRQACTENQQYRPRMVECPGGGQNMAQPTCNGGLGCSTCWARYEKDYKKMSDKWCD